MKQTARRTGGSKTGPCPAAAAKAERPGRGLF